LIPPPIFNHLIIVPLILQSESTKPDKGLRKGSSFKCLRVFVDHDLHATQLLLTALVTSWHLLYTTLNGELLFGRMKRGPWATAALMLAMIAGLAASW
jgi:hypothetical protein